jgi:glycosyltransferase involved in cell wall biosynthesis
VRVVHLTSSHPPDDVRIFLKECRSLAQDGYDVHLVAPGTGSETRDRVTIHGFELPTGARPVRVVRRLWRAARQTRKLKPDLCQFHEPELVLVALLLKLDGTRIVYDVHEHHTSAVAHSLYTGGGRRLAFRLLEAVARRTCHAFVAATPAIALEYPADRTVAVLNYPLREEFVAPAPAARDRSDVVYVGGLTRSRGVREMVEAVARLRDEQARLVLVGTFDDPSFEQEVRALPGWSRVEHTGWLGRREVAERLAEARIGLVLLHPEPDFVASVPIKLFEYMSAGLPVVASDFPYWRTLLDPIGCATFVDPLDPARIAAAINTLLSDETAAREMGTLGARVVRERLNWELEAPKLRELYERLGLTTAEA